MTATSDEILFRPFRPRDAETLLRWARTPDELLQWAGPRFSFPLDERQLAEYADTSDGNRHLISAVTGTTETVLAHAELTVLPQHELGQVGRFAVAPEMRGRGIAGRLMDWLVAFAFDDLHLHKLELVAFSFNEPALRCYKRAGFREEGLARDARKASDGYWDLVHMGLFEDWRHESTLSPASQPAGMRSMDRDHALSVLQALHDAQNAMYSGGDVDAVRALLSEEIEWHVPGENAIAGDYHGVDEVVDYFHRRRALASNTLRLHPGEILLGATHVAVLTDGTAIFDGIEHRWSTTGLYQLRGRQIAACWLLPLDQNAFDRAWTGHPSRR